MRPKKKILLFSADEDELSRLGYLLWVRQFKPVLVATGKDALAALAEGEFDCAMVMANVYPAMVEAVVRGIAGARPDLPIVLFAPKGAAFDAGCLALAKTGADMAEMVETLRLLCARKRGPKTAGSLRSGPRDYLTSDLQRVG